MSFSSWARSRLDLWRRHPFLTIRFILYVWYVWYVFNGLYKRLAFLERTSLPPKCLPYPSKRHSDTELVYEYNGKHVSGVDHHGDVRDRGHGTYHPDEEPSYRGVGSLHFDGTKWLCACTRPNSWSGETCEFDIQADKQQRRATRDRELREAQQKVKAKYPDL